MGIYSIGGVTVAAQHACVLRVKDQDQDRCYSGRNTASTNTIFGNSEFGNGSSDRRLLLCNFLPGILFTEKRHGGTTCSSNTFTQPAISLLEECRGAALWAESGKHAQPLK